MWMCRGKCDILKQRVAELSKVDGSLKGMVHRYGQRGKDMVCVYCEMAIRIEFIEKVGLPKNRCFCCNRVYRNGGLIKRSPDHPKYHGNNKKVIKVKRY